MLKAQAQIDEYNSKDLYGVGNKLGTILNRKVGVMVGQYDFAKQGGAIGAKNLLEDLNDPNSGLTLPINAVIKQVAIQILTAFASVSTTGTISLGANTAVDLLAAVDADTLSGISSGIPTGVAANMVALTAARNLQLSIASSPMTQGKCAVYIEYYVRK